MLKATTSHTSNTVKTHQFLSIFKKKREREREREDKKKAREREIK